MGEYICDDRMYEPGGLLDKVMHLSEEEFNEFVNNLRTEEEDN